MYRQVLDPVGPLWVSAVLAALPVLALFVLLGIVRARAWVAAAGGLAVALLVAVAAYSMPAGQALRTATLGGAFGLFPLAFTVVTAIWIYTMTVDSGHFDVLRRSFERVSDDRRVQAIVIAFCFGSLLEALAGQGTPVAITSVMLIAVGFRPVLAATTALVANTVPAAFGPLGLPITTLARVTDLPYDELGAMAGRQVPVVAVFVPLLVVAMVDGRRGVRERGRLALACGLAYGAAQFAATDYVAVALADILAAAAGMAVVALLVRRERAAVPALAGVPGGGPVGDLTGAPTGPVAVGGPAPAPGSAPVPVSGSGGPGDAVVDPRSDVIKAYVPYATIVAIFSLSQWSVIADVLNDATLAVDWPGLHLFTAGGAPSTLSVYRFNWLSAPGSLLILAGLVTCLALRITPDAAVRAYGRAAFQLRWAVLTVTFLLALSFVMNASGQAATLGSWMAGAGGFFAVLSPVLGWLGVALTGSDTSSNSLFGALQVTAAERTGLDPTLLAAANASGGVVGKMISLQNLSIVAGAVGLSGREGDLFRRMFGWSLLLLGAMCLVVGLQSTPVLDWMVP